MVGRAGYDFAVLAVLCAAVFFFIFPMTQGPYSVVHGPATTLTSIRARRMLWSGMARAARLLRSPRRSTSGFDPLPNTLNDVVLPLSLPTEQIVLRC